MKLLMYLIMLLPAVIQAQLFVQPNTVWQMQRGSDVTVQGSLESFSDLSGEGTLIAGGDAMQSFNIHGFSISNLLINNPTNISLASELNITGSLQLLNGNIYCGENDFLLDKNASIVAAQGLSVHTNGSGKIKKIINGHLSGYYVPVGNGTEAVPVSWTTDGNGSNGVITISAKAVASPAKPGDIADYVENYWVMETSGLNSPVRADAWYTDSRIRGDQQALQGFYLEGSAWKPSAISTAATGKKMSALVTNKYTQLFVMSSPHVAGMSLFPNPATNKTTVEAYAQTGEPALLKLVDVRGRIVETRMVVVVAGINRFEYLLDGLVPGSYMIQLTGKNITYSKKLLKL